MSDCAINLLFEIFEHFNRKEKNHNTNSGFCTDKFTPSCKVHQNDGDLKESCLVRCFLLKTFLQGFGIVFLISEFSPSV